MIGGKETLCSSCGHLQVCSIKHTFLLVQEEINRLIISTHYICVIDELVSIVVRSVDTPRILHMPRTLSLVLTE